MPYGLPKEIGGDSPENEEKMKHCIKRVMAQGKSKVSAIRICKVSLMVAHKKGK